MWWGGAPQSGGIYAKAHASREQLWKRARPVSHRAHGLNIPHGEPLTPMQGAEPPAGILTMSGAAMARNGLVLSQIGAKASRIVLNVFPYSMQCRSPHTHQGLSLNITAHV